MKHITVSVPDEVYRRARIRAAERGTSVSAIVAEYLTSLCGGGTEFTRLEEQQRRIQRQVKHFRVGDRLDRTDLHDRSVR